MQASKTLILASASQSRASILRNAGIQFRSVPSLCNENEIKKKLRKANVSTLIIAKELAKAKADIISKKYPKSYVIAADQMLECEGISYDKPKDSTEAHFQLKRLRGKTHYLYSGAVVYKASACLWHHSGKIEMRMREFTDKFLEEYINVIGLSLCESVGAYKLEGIGSQLFEEIKGDYFSILGLPLLPLMGYLRQAGVIKA